MSVRELSHDCQDHENRQHDHCDFPEVLHEAHIYSLLDDRVKPNFVRVAGRFPIEQPYALDVDNGDYHFLSQLEIVSGIEIYRQKSALAHHSSFRESCV